MGRLASLALALAVPFLWIGILFWHGPAAGGEQAVVVPPPTVDEKPEGDRLEKTVLAGGCFWGIQGVFEHVQGVTKAVSGYTGGSRLDARYEVVGSGSTGHAESVEITYNPHQITYGQLLQIYFSVAHDPTQRNRQGPDVGSQYRSTLFPVGAEQKKIAQAYIAQLGEAGAYAAPIVTTVEMGKAFYPAEAYHQDFLAKNPTHAYIVANDLPKIENLKRLFPDLYRNQPILVSDSAR
jgi:peptide-methionine (S)-S-oxide reductase